MFLNATGGASRQRLGGKDKESLQIAAELLLAHGDPRACATQLIMSSSEAFAGPHRCSSFTLSPKVRAWHVQGQLGIAIRVFLLFGMRGPGLFIEILRFEDREGITALSFCRRPLGKALLQRLFYHSFNSSGRSLDGEAASTIEVC